LAVLKLKSLFLAKLAEVAKKGKGFKPVLKPPNPDKPDPKIYHEDTKARRNA
jgi:hypothetical protein